MLKELEDLGFGVKLNEGESVFLLVIQLILDEDYYQFITIDTRSVGEHFIHLSWIHKVLQVIAHKRCHPFGFDFLCVKYDKLVAGYSDECMSVHKHRMAEIVERDLFLGHGRGHHELPQRGQVDVSIIDDGCIRQFCVPSMIEVAT